MITQKGISLKMAVDQLAAAHNMGSLISDPNIVNAHTIATVRRIHTDLKTADPESGDLLAVTSASIETLRGLIFSPQKGLPLNDCRELNRLISEITHRLTYVITKEYNPNVED
ncbi:hypothetical protein VpasPP24_44 [Vibrio phage Vpas_PP24]|nr:hypothetical protein VpasPP24_44 [Vibrio phage Vpas_PP24]